MTKTPKASRGRELGMAFIFLSAVDHGMLGSIVSSLLAEPRPKTLVVLYKSGIMPTLDRELDSVGPCAAPRKLKKCYWKLSGHVPHVTPMK